MAPRLALIVSQPAQRESATVELIENMIAAAILVPGLDANLVGDIESMAPDSTDCLCLRGHSRDVVLASFLDMASAEAAWKRLALSGSFIDFSTDEAAIRSAIRAGGTGRNIFYFPLTWTSNVSTLLDACHQLLTAQRLSLVSIQLSPISMKAQPARPGRDPQSAIADGSHTRSPTLSQSPNSQSPNSQSPNSQSLNHSSPEPARSTTSEVHPATTRSSAVASAKSVPTPPIVNSHPTSEVDYSSLDKLVDDLDALDL